MMMSRRSCSSRYPFTPTQWQELEHQALIYKYMASGIPIPSDLLLPIKRSFFSSTSSTSIPFPHQPTIGWSCFQMGYGRKAEDPEPGRCRRTDGKKWRCSKEAYPDSKYCERHMHRGKNRSRKPVEISLTSTTNSNSTSSSLSSFSSSSSNPPLSISTPDSYYPYHLLYPHPFAPQNNTTTHFQLDSGSYSSSDRDYRYGHGMKDVDEYTFFSEASRGDRGSSWELRPLGLGEPKQSTTYYKEEEKNKHCFVLGADFKLEKSGKEEREEEENQRPLRHFFDEWPQKSKDSWMDLEGENSNQGSYSKTQLSISIPMGLHDFPQ